MSLDGAAPNAYICVTVTETAQVIFARWVASQGPDRKSQLEAAAEALDVSVSMIRKLLAGERGPGLDLAFRIEEATKRRIRARDWVEAAA